MLRQASAKSTLLELLDPYFEHKHYSKCRGVIDFYCETNFGHSSIIISVSGNEGDEVAELFPGIRHNLVEHFLIDLFGTNAYYNTWSHSLLPSWRFLQSEMESFRLPCNTPAEIDAAIDRFIDFMDRRGFDFLNHYRELAKIDQLLNDRPKVAARWCNHNYQRCFRALATAKLLNRPDYDRMFLMNQQYMAERGFAGKIMQKFNTTFANYKDLSLN
jgi:hypothetical protein